MISKIIIGRIDDDDSAHPYRITLLNENDERIIGARYLESWEAVSAARGIQRDWAPLCELIDTLKRHDSCREVRYQWLDRRDQLRSDHNE